MTGIRKNITAGLVCIAGILAARAEAQVVYPKRALVDLSTGYLESYVAGDWYTGSGVIARDSRLVYSCGHLFYEDGVWATDYLFYPGYNDSSSPDPSRGIAPRGFRYFTSYANNVKVYGSSSSRAFAYDFTVFYRSSPFGTAIATAADGRAALVSDELKRIVGYPSSIDFTRARGYSYQHATDWFTNQAYPLRGSYYGFDGVSTGPGNSGGPVFVQDTGAETYSLAGILVSGSYSTAGAYALDAAAEAMANSALGASGSVQQVYRNTSSRRLPDAARGYVNRRVDAAGFTGNISDLTFNMKITTPRRGDLDVYLQSPSGRIRWINKKSRNNNRNLVVKKADYSANFRGLAANGPWRLKMRDSVRKNRAVFEQFSISINAPR